MKDIAPLAHGLDATIVAPPSKAHTLRAIFISALASGISRIAKPLYAQDQLVAIEAMRKFGAVMELEDSSLTVEGTGREMEVPSQVHAGNSGVSMRFLCPIAGLAGKGGERILIDGSGRMRQRPVGDLLEALGKLGGGARSIHGNGCPPVEIMGRSLRGGTAAVDCSKSSQFASALLLALPLAPENSELELAGNLSSRPYVGITLDMAEKFGAKIARGDDGRDFSIGGGQSYSGRDFAIEGDYSSAVFFFQAAAISGGRVRVEGLVGNSLQADAHALPLLERMGCEVKRNGHSVEVTGPEELKPLDADLSDCPDASVTLAVACAFAGGKSKLRGLENLRLKESDRLQVLSEGLNAIGAMTVVTPDGLEISGNRKRIRGAAINPHDDHRIAMAFSIAGLAAKGMAIENPECVKKSFPSFFEEMEKLRG
ncbi:3-phosphoshikimate 1-carboxyvinyltransferase [Candidatus Micrarchaeota archaeon]|nr:3-phosphoshikimate 1-carboxyvinyltransferase [Candidatus Micrarchaeota archaeon]MBI5176456.1 3-phosphoshikimate 1-carboxyvinyltransferase [Candidatus Micrarchaeota archaeon]